MSASLLHTLAAASIFPDVLSSAVIIGGMRHQMLRSGLEVRRETISGIQYPQFQGVYARKPLAEFSTVQLARALDVCSFTGLAIASASDPGVKFYGQKKLEGGARASGSNHIVFIQREGIMVPDRITVSHQQDAEIFYRSLITFDGTNDPLALTEGVGLATDPTDDQRYTIGKVQVGTVTGDKLTIDQIESIDINFGVAAQTYGCDGEVDDTIAYIDEIMPTISITTSNVTLFDSSGVGLNGKVVDSSHTVVCLRKRNNNGVFVADGTSEHIQFVPFSGLAFHDSIFDVRHNANGTCTLVIQMLGDASNAPLAIDTTATNSLPA